MKSSLHEKQIKLLDYLGKIKSLEGLSYWHIARETALNNAQTVKHHLNQLEKHGYFRRNLSNPFLFEILKKPVEDIAYIPLYGFAQCGNDAEFFSDGNLDDEVAVSTKLLGISNLSETFAVRAKGDSMVPKILDNDLVIFQKQDDVDTGSIGLVMDNGEPKIKEVIKNDDKQQIILRSLNKTRHPDKIIPYGEDFSVVGLIRGVIHSF